MTSDKFTGLPTISQYSFNVHVYNYHNNVEYTYRFYKSVETGKNSAY